MFLPRRALTLLALVLVAVAGATPVRAQPAAADPAGVLAATSTGWVIGDGTPTGCTSAAVVQAVARGGVITFACGSQPVTIVMTETAKVRNDAAPRVVIDGGNLVTLSGGGTRRILYQDTCDPAQVWTTDHCNDQPTPRLVVRNLTFADGNSTGQTYDGGGGGAIFVRGGLFSIAHSRFVRNRCDTTGPDLGGGAVRVLDQYADTPVPVTGSTFGGSTADGNVCSNGGALSSIGVSWNVTGSTFAYNTAVGNGANPPRSGTPGGGSGGAIYNDGDTMTLKITKSWMHDNHANEGGGAIFFVSNDGTGTLVIDHSTLRRNVSAGFETTGYPGIFFIGQGQPIVTDSTIKP